MRAAYVPGEKSVLHGFVWIKGREDKKCIVRLLFHRKLCPGAPLFGFSGTFAAIFGGSPPPCRGFSDTMTFSGSGSFFSFKTPSPSHHVPSSPKPHSNRQLQPPRSIFQGIMQPALLDRRNRLARNHSTLIPTPLGLLFRLFCIFRLQSTSRRVGISLRVESGERCGMESCSSPSPGGPRRMCRISPMQSPPSCALCQAFV